MRSPPSVGVPANQSSVSGSMRKGHAALRNRRSSTAAIPTNAQATSGESALRLMPNPQPSGLNHNGTHVAAACPRRQEHEGNYKDRPCGRSQEIQEVIAALDEFLLLRHVELAGNDIRLVIFEPQAMQQRDQSRTAFVGEAEFPRDKGADLARRARQRRAGKTFKASSCAAVKKLAPPPMSKLIRPSIPRCSNSLRPLRIVSSFSNNASATF
jgi:hypothetical protein